MIPEIADVITMVGLLGTVGGSVGSWCTSHNCKRDVVGNFDAYRIKTGRDDVGPCGVPSYNFDQCKSQLNGVQVTSSIPSPGVAQFDNVPPACMDLAVVLAGTCTGEGTHPVPCGSACMQYTGLTDAQMGSLSKSLNAA
ncbi:hypothetical protein GQ53DRAFT_660745 [Thozetella sp. PMI_491]|nr:hypothetical protein GQ53DRAFT_660745 [Thozetella sp. PMI_491]